MNAAFTNFKAFADDMFNAWRAGAVSFGNWLNDSSLYSSLCKDFQMDYLPEPYYYYELSGSQVTDACFNNPLFVLNNNPGGGLHFQHRNAINSGPVKFKCYDDCSNYIANTYYRSNKYIGDSACRRIQKAIECANKLGCDGIIFVETFFLHSKKLNKIKYLKLYNSEFSKPNSKIIEYSNLLKNVLKGEKVLCITAVRPGISLGYNNINYWKNGWMQHQAGLIGLDLSSLNSSNIIPIIINNNKCTSCLIKKNNKYMVCMQGSNNIPNNILTHLP